MDRFADIWGGLLAQRCLAGAYGFWNGSAVVYHARASNRETNLKKEAPGLEIHEEVCAALWGMTGLMGMDQVLAYRILAERVEGIDHAYFKQLGPRMRAWLKELHV